VRPPRRHRGVEYAVPNLIAHASGFVPNDPGRVGTPAGWQELQWNFAPDNGIDAPDAWTNVAAAGHLTVRRVVCVGDGVDRLVRVARLDEAEHGVCERAPAVRRRDTECEPVD